MRVGVASLLGVGMADLMGVVVGESFSTDLVRAARILGESGGDDWPLGSRSPRRLDGRCCWWLWWESEEDRLLEESLLLLVVLLVLLEELSSGLWLGLGLCWLIHESFQLWVKSERKRELVELIQGVILYRGDTDVQDIFLFYNNIIYIYSLNVPLLHYYWLNILIKKALDNNLLNCVCKLID